MVNISAAEFLPLEKLKEIINSKHTYKIIDEMKSYPFQRKAALKIHSKDLVNNTVSDHNCTVESKYVQGKYVVSIRHFDNKKFYTVVSWDFQKNRYKKWSVTADDKIGMLYGKRDSNKIYWQGMSAMRAKQKSTTTIHEDKVTYKSFLYGPNGHPTLESRGEYKKAP